MKKFFVLMIAIVFYAMPAAAQEIPYQAKDAGYNVLTFSSSFAAQTIDMDNLRTSGFDWYRSRFFGWDPTEKDTIKPQEGGGVLLTSGGDKVNANLITAGYVKGSKKWVGKVFGGGGYFEAELSFDPALARQEGRKGWPSFWGMAIEHLAGLPHAQWDGQGWGYEHFIEVDMFEYLYKDPESRLAYGGNIHDWFGVWKETCAPKKQFCKHSIPYKQAKRYVPEGTDFTKPHRYGFLWVPATEKTKGWAQFFFDGKPIGAKTTWSLFDGQEPETLRKAWTFGILDRQHLALFVGTGRDQPMKVNWVKVWQKSDAQNWVQ